KGFSLGQSGVLFVALVFGHLGLNIPSEIKDLGIILFVYMVGLQAGPRFFNTFKKRGLVYVQLGIIIVITSMIVTVIMAYIFNIPAELAVGIFVGALTSTPGLAAAVEASKSSIPSVGYGIAYPFGIIGIILFVQLLPKFLKIDLKETEKRIISEEKNESRSIVKKVLVVQNPAVDGKNIKDLNCHAITKANISRVQHKERILPAKSDTVLHLGDFISVIGLESEINKLKLILGPEVKESKIFKSQEVIYKDVFISENSFAGKTLSKLRIHTKYSVIITRIRRDGLEFSPTGNFVLEIGDLVRVVGTNRDCARFRKDAGQHVKHIQETNVLTFAVGIILGSILGFTPINIPGGITIRLGLAGGPLLVALLFSHFGRIGPVNIRVPYGAKYILRELGLVFFLAGVGTGAGRDILNILQEHGMILLVGIIFITIIPLIIGYYFSIHVFKFNIFSMLGIICGGMTSSTALGVVTSTTESEAPAVAYTAIYPVALIFTTVAAQLLIALL
ncbi:aspartate:alanine exchanger family transporter, partial [candidate division KSB1 bacterium]